MFSLICMFPLHLINWIIFIATFHMNTWQFFASFHFNHQLLLYRLKKNSFLYYFYPLNNSVKKLIRLLHLRKHQYPKQQSFSSKLFLKLKQDKKRGLKSSPTQQYNTNNRLSFGHVRLTPQGGSIRKPHVSETWRNNIWNIWLKSTTHGFNDFTTNVFRLKINYRNCKNGKPKL